MSKKEVDNLTQVNINNEIRAGEAISADTLKNTCDANKMVVALNFPRAVKFVVDAETPDEKELVFYGNANDLIGKEQGILPVGGTYGLTPNVDKKDWEKVLAQYGDSPLIRQKLLLADTPDKIRNTVAEHNYTRHGYEPINKEEAKN